MKVQEVYDFREEFALCSGQDLHEFFRAVLGEPAPSGYRDIPNEATCAFFRNEVARMRRVSPLAMGQATEALKVAFRQGRFYSGLVAAVLGRYR